MKIAATIILIFTFSSIGGVGIPMVTKSTECKNEEEKVELKIGVVDNIEELLNYEEFFSYISTNSSLPFEFVVSYYWFENGKGSTLSTKHNNFGGIKYYPPWHSKYAYVSFRDDCGSNKCKFASFPSVKVGADEWVRILNSKRYDECKALELKECFECFQRKGYHTANQWRQRYKKAKYVQQNCKIYL